MDSKSPETKWDKKDLCIAYAVGAGTLLPMGQILVEPMGWATWKMLEVIGVNDPVLQLLIGFPVGTSATLYATAGLSVAAGSIAGNVSHRLTLER